MSGEQAMRTETKIAYTLEADDDVFENLYYQDVMDALRLAVRDECSWEVLDLDGTSYAYFVDRRGQPFEIRHDPACVTVEPGTALTNREFKPRRKRLPNGNTVYSFKPPIRRRAATRHAERSAPTGGPSSTSRG